MRIVINVKVRGKSVQIDSRAQGASTDSVRETNIGNSLLDAVNSLMKQIQDKSNAEASAMPVVTKRTFNAFFKPHTV